MSDTVLVAVITALGVVIAALLTAGLALLASVRRNTKATRVQVENNHQTNLRDEQDDRHAEISRLDTFDQSLGLIITAVGSIQDHLGIEHTMPRPPQRRK